MFITIGVTLAKMCAKRSMCMRRTFAANFIKVIRRRYASNAACRDNRIVLFVLPKCNVDSLKKYRFVRTAMGIFFFFFLKLKRVFHSERNGTVRFFHNKHILYENIVTYIRPCHSHELFPRFPSAVTYFTVLPKRFSKKLFKVSRNVNTIKRTRQKSFEETGRFTGKFNSFFLSTF